MHKGLLSALLVLAGCSGRVSTVTVGPPDGASPADARPIPADARPISTDGDTLACPAPATVGAWPTDTPCGPYLGMTCPGSYFACPDEVRTPCTCEATREGPDGYWHCGVSSCPEPARDAGHGADTGPRDASPPVDAGCEPKSCPSAGATCGTIPDGCGGMLECGTCDPPGTCGGGGQPGVCGGGEGICPTVCTSNAECQAGCPSDGAGSVNCCDPITQACFATAQSVCPE
jgi:hypothetical protein